MSKTDKKKHSEPKPDARRSPLGADEKIAELTADLQRLQAEFINFRRRSEEGRAEILDLARQDVVLHLLPLLDNIDRALSHRPEELKDNPWAKGVAQIAKQAVESLKELGVERINSLGQPFDPHLHEAIGMEDGDGDVEVVVEELQPGYKLGDKVIRHAMVKVGRRAEAPPGRHSRPEVEDAPDRESADPRASASRRTEDDVINNVGEANG